MFSDDAVNRLDKVISKIPEKIENIIKKNKDLEDISKELLGESLSEDILTKVIEKEIYKEVLEEMMGAIYGE
tara:strand:- start:5183 stop:5398 length:216 start_codon:yes stop_codon:yes gene_type:complete